MRRAPLFAALLAFASCGLVSRDVTTVSFDLPTKTYTFDTATWKLPSGRFPRVACGAGQQVVDCCHAQEESVALDCQGLPIACESGVCTLRFAVSVVQPVNLAMESPSLASVGDQSLVDVFVSQIQYSVRSSLDVDLPAVDLYVAPAGVTSPADPAAQKFGTVPVTPAMTSRDGLVTISPDSEAIFSPYAHAPATPFNLIAAATVVLASGSPIPSGRVDITITGQLSAELAP